MPPLPGISTTPGRVFVRITASEPQFYATDGVNIDRYEPRLLYQVPFHIARGMLEKGVARIISEQDLKDEPDEEPALDLTHVGKKES